MWHDADIVKDLEEFSKYLKGGTPTAGHVFKYTPDPTDMETYLFNAHIYTADATVTGGKYYTKEIQYTDPVSHYLLSWMGTTKAPDNIDYYRMDMDYKTGWRQLEQLYYTGLNLARQIKDSLAPCVPVDCSVILKANAGTLKDLDNFYNKRLSNSTWDMLTKKAYFKKWLWYSDGYLLINPLGATTPDRRYPANEKNSQLTDDIMKALPTGDAEDSLLIKVLTTKKVRNEILLANSSNKNQVVYFNAANKYQLVSKDNLTPIKSDDSQLDLVVFNVGQKETLQVNLDKSAALTDQGAIVQAIIDASSSGGSLATILSNAASWVTAWQKVSGSVNGFEPLPKTGPISFQAPTAVGSVASSSNLVAKRYQNKSLFKQDIDAQGRFLMPYNYDKIEDIAREATDKECYVIIKERKIAATKTQDVDKVNFIFASFIKTDKDICNHCGTIPERCIIDSFIIRDRCYALDYNTESEFASQALLMLQRFECYTKAIDECRAKLAEKYRILTTQYLPVLKALLSITQRSLPPLDGDLVEKENKDPDLRTVILSPDLPDPPKKIVYQVTSSLPGKRAEGKDPAEKNVVIQQSFKYVKRHWVDFSVGLAYTLSDYQIATISGNLPKLAEGDRFKPIAGMHIYFGGLVKVDNRIKPDLSRISLFLDLGLSQALDNLNPALSYDVVPGIRLMGGLHFYKDTRYKILNNVVIDQASAYRQAGGFFSLNMEPLAFASFIGFIK